MDKFDAIIVGGGLSGLAAAYTLADNGLEVLLIEKGDYSGAKNVTGGRMYVNPVRDMFPELWKKAPFERQIVHEELNIMAEKSSITVRYEDHDLAEDPGQSYSVTRAKFDKWFAKQAERRGAMIVTKSRVDDLIINNGKVEGVIAGGEELHANVVIACDGVLSFISEKAGLKKNRNPENYAVGFKEIIELDPAVIEERFNLSENKGAARLFMGEVTRGKFGGGFLYTNKDSLSLGIVAGIKQLYNEEPGFEAPQLLEEFKKRPEIASLIKGGSTVEYSAHVIAEGGYKALEKLYGNGIITAGDAAGLSMNIGVTVRGMEYAIASGYFAARAVILAKEKNDFSEKSLSVYQELLDQSFVMKDLKTFKHVPHVLETPAFFNKYPEFACSIMKDIYTVSDKPKESLYKTIRRHMSIRQLFSMAKDLKGVRKI